MSLKDYTPVSKIGQGSYGEVWLYNCKTDKAQYVLKKMCIADPDVRKSAEVETESLLALSHANIVKYKAYFIQADQFYLIMEYCDGGDLGARIKKQGATKLPEEKIVLWTAELCLALQHIHDRNIIHRDLKPQNIFLTAKESCKIGDFGISRLLKPGDLATTSVGTPLYVSPEIIRGIPYDNKTDVWSLGCVVYEMMALEPAVNPMVLIREGRRLIGKMPAGYSAELIEITDSMLTIEAADRPTIKDLLNGKLLNAKALSNAAAMKNYKKLNKIGQGSYGEVWLYKNLTDKQQYVLKKMSIGDPDVRKSAEIETRSLLSLCHPNIVLYKDCFLISDQFYLIMEYCDGGDLAGKIQKQGSKKLPEDKIVQWTFELCLALQHIHDRNIIHRDLKPQNVFLTKSDVVKIGDFGISRLLKPGDLATTAIGTPLYVSPEIIRAIPYGNKTDVWSLGCCIFELMALSPAVDPIVLLRQGVRQIGKMPVGYSAELCVLVDSMLTIEAADRPSIKDLLNSKLLKAKLGKQNGSVDPAVSTVAASLDDTHIYVTMNRPRRGSYNEALTQRQQAEAALLAVGFIVDHNTKVVDAINGAPFKYDVSGNKDADEKRYQSLAKALTDYVQASLQIDHNMSKEYVPVDGKPGEAKTFVFLSHDFSSNTKKLMVMVQGNGAPRAGEWARKVMINDSLDAGSQIRWVERAQKEGFAVILLNPNEDHEEIAGKLVPVRENGSSYEHVQYVWNNVISKSPAKQIAIVAHSYGGTNVVELAMSITDEFLRRVAVIAMTDSVHVIHKKIPKKFISFCQKNARNWISTDEPLDKPMDTPPDDIPRVSAGDSRHEWTTWKSFASVFTFIKSHLH